MKAVSSEYGRNNEDETTVRFDVGPYTVVVDASGGPSRQHVSSASLSNLYRERWHDALRRRLRFRRQHTGWTLRGHGRPRASFRPRRHLVRDVQRRLYVGPPSNSGHTHGRCDSDWITGGSSTGSYGIR